MRCGDLNKQMIEEDAELSVVSAPIWYVALEAPYTPKRGNFSQGLGKFPPVIIYPTFLEWGIFKVGVGIGWHWMDWKLPNFKPQRFLIKGGLGTP